MQILCPINKKNEIMPLVKLGAERFYTGASAKIMFDKETNDGGTIVNCRPWGHCNFNSLVELREAVDLIHKLKKKVYLAINSPSYSESEISQIMRFLQSFKDLDGLIVSDISLIIEIRKKFKGMMLIASTGAHILNGEAVKFYECLGVKNIVIPRHFTVKEIEQMVKSNPHTEFECFIKNEGCFFTQGLCFFSHDLFMPKGINCSCGHLNGFKVHSKLPDKNKKIEKWLRNFREIAFTQCGACAIYDLKKAGVKKIKIVGRGEPFQRKMDDFEFINDAVNKTHLSREKFMDFVRTNHERIYKQKCKNNCSYD